MTDREILGRLVNQVKALASVMEPELRAGIPEDLGRFRDTGWVGELEAGLIWTEADFSRVIHVTSL